MRNRERISRVIAREQPGEVGVAALNALGRQARRDARAERV